MPIVASKRAPAVTGRSRKPVRLRIGVGIEGGLGESLAAGPVAGAAHLVRIRLAGDGVGQPGHAAGMERSRPPGEARDREVEAAPEEVHRARLSEEAAPEQLEDAIGLDEHPPEAMGRLGVVAGVGAVLRERDGVGHLVRQLVDRHRDAEVAQEVHGSR